MTSPAVQLPLSSLIPSRYHRTVFAPNRLLARLVCHKVGVHREEICGLAAASSYKHLLDTARPKDQVGRVPSDAPYLDKIGKAVGQYHVQHEPMAFSVAKTEKWRWFRQRGHLASNIHGCPAAWLPAKPKPQFPRAQRPPSHYQ